MIELSLECGNHRAVKLFIDEVADRVGVQGFHQSLDCLIVLVALFHHQHVDIGRVGRLNGQSIRGGIQAGTQSVVGIDDRQVQIGPGAGQGLRLDLLELQVLGVVNDVVGGSGEVGAVVQGDQALGLQQSRARPSLVASLGTAMTAPSGRSSREETRPA